MTEAPTCGQGLAQHAFNPALRYDAQVWAPRPRGVPEHSSRKPTRPHCRPTPMAVRGTWRSARTRGWDVADVVPRRPSPFGLREAVQGNSSIEHVGPGASASRASSVTSGAPISSASATYTASYVVRFARSSHQRSSKDRCGTRRMGRDFRSSRASCIRRSSRPPRAARRRLAERTSTSSRCGAARRSPAKRARWRSPSGPSSANAVTMTLASTTITASRDRRAPP